MLSLAIGFFSTLFFLDEERTADQQYNFIGSYTFLKDLPDTKYLVAGWAEPEDWGVWSVGERTELSIDLAERQYWPVRLTIDARPFVAPQHEQQIVNVIISGKKVGQWRYRKGQTRKSLVIPRNLVENRKRLKIIFLIEQPRSPKELGISPDGRKLGIGLQSLRLEAVL